jgi:hypothetical protein
MKQFIITAILIGSAYCSFAQQSPVSAGGEATGTGGSMSYSIGQVSYKSNNQMTDGVQQPYEILVVGEKNKNIELSWNAYPNPVRSHLTLATGTEFTGLSYSLYDMSLKLIRKESIQNSETSIDMSELATSTYILKVTSSTNQELSTFKIIKN